MLWILFWPSEKLLPSSVLATILDTIIMPKLSSAVGTWEPHQETIPIHTWVHPWLPMLGHKLEGIYQTIRFKLSTVLDAWHPSDGSAYAILSPWKPVFDSDSWQQLMHRFIVPKLKAVFVSDDFQVNPASQKLDQFYWVMNWASVIPDHLMVDTMDIFFTKWLTVLYCWLCSNPNFNEVLKWFLGWKELIPKELLANELIRYKLNCGLVMMNQAAEGMEVVQPGLKEKISYYIRVSEQRKCETHQKAAAYVSADGANEMSVKEIIEAYARDHGLLFKLKPGRMHNGHQIYGFGNVSIIIDSLNQKVYTQNEDRWSLETLGRLLELHNRSLSKRR
ncbi:septin and tuftelin-interacting protein 1 homolog 1-like [Trifolium pratense]|uniref:septin and tuftelin-interacting protein 1 homolog 1-like n=1 Tax=Trifolium pratense TaxID=57577 RepID=UPI001E697F97|nr:septin and tuftelin-interacting protein 1 homolog 1-like [Trifolium pratense]